MELKYVIKAQRVLAIKSSNRTFMELKWHNVFQLLNMQKF